MMNCYIIVIRNNTVSGVFDAVGSTGTRLPDAQSLLRDDGCRRFPTASRAARRHAGASLPSSLRLPVCIDMCVGMYVDRCVTCV